MINIIKKTHRSGHPREIRRPSEARFVLHMLLRASAIQKCILCDISRKNKSRRREPYISLATSLSFLLISLSFKISSLHVHFPWLLFLLSSILVRARVRTPLLSLRPLHIITCVPLYSSRLTTLYLHFLGSFSRKLHYFPQFLNILNGHQWRFPFCHGCTPFLIIHFMSCHLCHGGIFHDFPNKNPIPATEVDPWRP